MTISTRTPEGLPSHCSLCGASVNIEYSDPAGDAPCPQCGQLLWASDQLLNSVTERLQRIFSTSPGAIDATTQISALTGDSLETVELIMELEEEFNVRVRADVASRIQTIGDFVRAIVDCRNK